MTKKEQYRITAEQLRSLYEELSGLNPESKGYNEKKTLYLNLLQIYNEQHKKFDKNVVLKSAAEIGAGIISAAVTIWGVRTTIKFEKDDVVTTTAGKSMFQAITKPRK